MTAARYYLITNRDDCGTTVAPDGALTYLSAPAGSNDFTAYSTQSDFLVDLEADLQSVGEAGSTQLGVFVHGFDTPWADGTGPGIKTTAQTWFDNLVGHGFDGVLLAFDWPSDAIGESIQDQMKRAKGMAQETAKNSFPLLSEVLGTATSKVASTEVSFLCHSMGNYLMQLGAGAFKNQGTPMIDRTLLVAAEIQHQSFNVGSGSPTSGADIVGATAGAVTVYFDVNDTILFGAGFLIDDYTELGFDGPTYDKTLDSSVVGVDARLANTSETAIPYEPKGTSSSVAVHIGYFWIPETLSDIAATMIGDSTTARTAVESTNGQGFLLNGPTLDALGNEALGRFGQVEMSRRAASSARQR